MSVMAESCENTELKFVAQQSMSVMAESCENTELKLLPSSLCLWWLKVVKTQS